MNRNLPPLFEKLIDSGLAAQSHGRATGDGFYVLSQSLADILGKRGITDFPDSHDELLQCSRFFDDWYLYAVADKQDFVYSLFKLREQEYNSREALPADGDTPGVTVSFIALEHQLLLECLESGSQQSRKRLGMEINRVVGAPGQRHHPALKAYFLSASAWGSYLVAQLYVRHIAGAAAQGKLAVPQHYRELYLQSRTQQKAKLCRLPRFIDSLNDQAGATVCDHEFLYLSQPLTEYEALAILATHTGNCSAYSFAAEVQYHAKFLTAPARLLFLGGSVYASAVRADMTVDDKEFEGPAPFYRLDSRLVRKQAQYHKNFRLSADGLSKQEE